MSSLDRFLTSADAERAARTLQRLARHGLGPLVLTGSFALELHFLARGAPPILPPLHDIDFLVDSFPTIPRALAHDLLLRHIHPHDPPAKTLLQGVDPATSIRIDIFRAYGNELARAQPITLVGIPVHIVALEDLLARHARLCCDILGDRPVDPKFARDFIRLLDLNVPDSAIEPVWREHRKPSQPARFAETVSALRNTIRERRDLLVPSAYSTDVLEICPRCHATPYFPLAPAQEILTHLGYC
jgi:hypothetical protein